MGEAIAEVGYLAGICAHDGTDWQKLKIDAEGRLEVSVVAGHEYVDRGDPSAADFDIGDLICNGTWRDLDLSGIITDSDAVLVHLRVSVSSSATGAELDFRKNGNVNTANVEYIQVLVTAVTNHSSALVSLDENLVIEYIGSATLDTVSIVVRGWWRPAA